MKFKASFHEVLLLFVALAVIGISIALVSVPLVFLVRFVIF